MVESGKKQKIPQEESDATTNENKESTSIFSMLDKLDSKSKEEGREIEEKLRIGLIKSEQVEKEKEPEKEKIQIFEIKKEIEKLRELKKNCYDKGEYDEAIEFSKKIITIAFENKLKSTVNEEKNFLDLVQNKIDQKPAELDNSKEAEDFQVVTAENKEVLVIDKESSGLEKTEIEANIVMDEEKISIEKEKRKLEQEKLKLDEEKEALKWEKQMMEEVIKFEREKEEDAARETNIKLEKIESEERKKFTQEQLKFKEEKEEFNKQRQEFEKEKELFKLEKEKFAEEKEALKWEKQMFEEARKLERGKKNDKEVLE